MGWKDVALRYQLQEQRDAEGQEKESPHKLVEQHGGAVLLDFFGGSDMQQRKDRVGEGAKQSQSDAQPVAHIQAEDEHHANDGDEADDELFPRGLFAVEEHIEKGGEEAGGSDAGHTDGDVRGLDAGVKSHPVCSQDKAAGADAGEVLSLRQVKPSHEKQRQGQGDDADEHPIPYQRQPTQRDQPPKDAGPPSQKDRQVKQE